MKVPEGKDRPADVFAKHSSPAPSKSENRADGGQMKSNQKAGK